MHKEDKIMRGIKILKRKQGKRNSTQALPWARGFLYVESLALHRGVCLRMEREGEISGRRGALQDPDPLVERIVLKGKKLRRRQETWRFKLESAEKKAVTNQEKTWLI